MKGAFAFFLLTSLMASFQVALAPQAKAQAQQRAKPEKAASFVERNIGLTAEPLTLAQLRARIHSKNETSRATPNVHVPGQTDHIVALSDGHGLGLEAYVTARGAVLIRRITLTEAGRELPAGLQISRSSVDDMYDRLGTNSEQNEKGPGGAFAKRYYNLERTASALLWFDRNEHLVGVEWRFGGD